jgi:hypothetical protein
VRVNTPVGQLAALSIADVVTVGWAVQVLKTGAVILMATAAARGGGKGPGPSAGGGASGGGGSAAGPGTGGSGPGPGDGGAAARGKAARPPAPAATPSTRRPPPAPVVSGSFKPFTRGNFRKNLIRLTGGAPEGAQAHHVFPKKFEKDFRKAGINIHDPHYGAWWRAGAHQSAADAYNARWDKFLYRDKPPSVEQILQFGRKIARDYGLHIYF